MFDGLLAFGHSIAGFGTPDDHRLRPAGVAGRA
jgi:hypothetical protein